ncbi:MAG: HDIG domain-containing protein, partial [Kofleriaceae bacterium]|nr:HDIG domain-containing protein [Kofleriaceae bacterium]
MPTTLNSAPTGNHSKGLVGSVLVAILAASLVTALLIAGRRSTATELEVGQPASVSLRTSPFQPDSAGNNPGGALVVSRGQTVTPSIAEFSATLERPNFSFGLTLWLALWAAFVLWGLVREPYARVRRTRQKLATVLFITLSSAVFLGITLTSSLALVALPVGLVGILVRQRCSQTTALASALLSALIVSLLVPFDLAFFCVILVQAIGPVLLLPQTASPIRQLGTGLVVGSATALAYLVAYYGSWSSIPSSAFGQSGALAAVIGGLVGSILALLLRPLFSWMSGDVSLRTLSKLERFSQPLLKQLADQAPGSWQHSLAVARLCESAGAAIGADIPLLRVGAYYHDLGKTKKPKYFIENNSGGEHSIHEKIKASDSRDAIFEHVSHGIQVAKDNGLPARIIDFIRTHHGAAQLEFFWSKELASGNAKQQSAEDFCYPGTTPQCPETAISCICDAVEAATRNGEASDEDELSDIVHQILFGKVRNHQLDHCGLGLPELQRIHLALTTILVRAHAKAVLKGHPVDVRSTAPQRPRPKNQSPASLSTIRLDSQDKPSNDWQSGSQKIQKDRDANATPINPAMAFNETLAMSVPDSDGIAADEMDSEPEDRASVRSDDSPANNVAENSALVSTVDISRPDSQPGEIKAKAAQVKAKPAEVKAKPAQVKTKPAEVKAKPAEVKAKP